MCDKVIRFLSQISPNQLIIENTLKALDYTENARYIGDAIRLYEKYTYTSSCKYKIYPKRHLSLKIR